MIKVHLPVAETLPRSRSSSNVVDINGGRGVIFVVVILITPPPRNLRGILALSWAYFEAPCRSRGWFTPSPLPGDVTYFTGLSHHPGYFINGRVSLEKPSPAHIVVTIHFVWRIARGWRIKMVTRDSENLDFHIFKWRNRRMSSDYAWAIRGSLLVHLLCILKRENNLERDQQRVSLKYFAPTYFSAAQNYNADV